MSKRIDGTVSAVQTSAGELSCEVMGMGVRGLAIYLGERLIAFIEPDGKNVRIMVFRREDAAVSVMVKKQGLPPATGG